MPEIFTIKASDLVLRVTDIKERLSTIELNTLVKKKVFQKFGTTGRGTYYTLHPALKAQKTHKRSNKDAIEQDKGDN